MTDCARTVIRIGYTFISPIVSAGGVFLTCHSLRFVLDKLHESYCSAGFFRSMITSTSGTCIALRSTSAHLSDVTLTSTLIVAGSLTGALTNYLNRAPKKQ